MRCIVLPVVAALVVGAAGRSAGAQDANLALSTDRAPRFLLASSPAPVPIDVSRTPVLLRRIAVDLRGMTLERALTTISAQAGFDLMYSKTLVALDRTVRLRAEDITVAAALTEVLLGAEVDVLFSASGQAALIRRAPPAGRAARRQVGSITGLVTDVETSQPVFGAQVLVVGTQQGALTDTDGRYTVGNVQAGARQVRVLRLGYNAVTQPVTVTDGQTVTLDFRLTQSTVTFDEVVVTATGQTQRKRESGATVGTIDVDSLQLSPINTFSDLLSSRVAGVMVQSASGITGSGSRIRVRGSNSISLSNDPLLIIDGVRVDNTSASTTIVFGGVQPSRFNDLNPEEIESVEVIKGPSAAALYGTAAANGVIQVTTKRGRSGRARFTAFAEGGSVREETDFPANYAQIGNIGGAAGPRITNCNIVLQGAGVCVPKADSLVSFNPLEQVSPFRTGYREKFGLNVSGGNDATTYFLSGGFDREQGVYAPNDQRDINLRSNVRSQLRDNLDVDVSAGYLSTRIQRAGDGDNFFGLITGGLLGRAFDDTAKRGYFFARPDKIFTAEALQRIQRFTGSVSANYLPIRWLTISGTAGLDYVDMEDGLFVPPGVFNPVTENPQFAVGIRQSDAVRFFNYTANGSATGTFALTPDLESSTTLGVQYTKHYRHGTNAFGQNLTPGTASLNGATQLFNVDEFSQEIVTLGVLAQQQFSWKDRVFVTGAVRTDENSAFGTNFDRVYYPAASVSWVIGEEPFFPANDVLSSLRLRAAYGESGQNPQFRQALTFFQPVTVAFLGVDATGVTVGGTGNADLKPEVSREFELGFDAGLFRDRASIELTYYHKNTENVLLQQQLAPSVGTSQVRAVNIGEVQNKGFEVSLNATLLQTRPVTFDLTVNGATNDNEVKELGAVPPLSFALGLQRVQKGYPLGGYWSRRLLSFNDANGDGVIGTTEVTLSDTAEFLDASPFPKRELSIAPTLTLYKYVRLSGLLDYRGGLKQANITEAFRCAAFAICRAIQDRNQPLSEQARAVAAALGNLGVYIEDADFWKLREVSVTLTPPVRWANRLGVAGLSLTLSGRNLATWTDYSGLDPEVNAIGQLDNFTTLDFVSAPPVRYYTARVEVTW